MGVISLRAAPAGWSRQWLGAVPAARIWAACQSLPSTPEGKRPGAAVKCRKAGIGRRARDRGQGQGADQTRARASARHGLFRLPPDEVVGHLVDLNHLGLRTIEGDRPLLLLAMDQMVRSGLSAYDAMYLALALSTDSRSATLDRRLAAAAGEAAMLIGPSGVSETRAEYRFGNDAYAGWSQTAVVGAHIAELRRRALAET